MTAIEGAALKEQNATQEVRAVKDLLPKTLPGDTTGLFPPELHEKSRNGKRRGQRG